MQRLIILPRSCKIFFVLSSAAIVSSSSAKAGIYDDAIVEAMAQNVCYVMEKTGFGVNQSIGLIMNPAILNQSTPAYVARNMRTMMEHGTKITKSTEQMSLLAMKGVLSRCPGAMSAIDRAELQKEIANREKK